MSDAWCSRCVGHGHGLGEAGRLHGEAGPQPAGHFTRRTADWLTVPSNGLHASPRTPPTTMAGTLHMQVVGARLCRQQ